MCVCAYLQDLTAIGITKPSARKKLKSEIGKLTIHDGIPDFKPVSVLFQCIYVTLLAAGFMSIEVYLRAFI